jgi:hypothetical protein
VRRMRKVLLALVAVGATIAVGCGSSPTAVSTADKNAEGVRALVREFVRDWRTGDYAGACHLATPSGRAAFAKATRTTCPRALATARSIVGDEKLARDEKSADSLDVTVSGDSASSPNPASPGEISHYVYRAGHWRID